MTTLGTLRNAPLACVLIALEFEEVPDFVAKVDKLKGELIPLLPRCRKEQLVQTLPATESAPQTMTTFEFISEDLHQALKLSPNQLSFMTTTYQRSTDLITFFEKLINIVWKTLEPLTTRIGVRYIDYILPKSDEQPEEYVQASIHGINHLELGQQDTMSAHITHYVFHDGAMIIRYATCVGTPALPPEIVSNNIMKSAIMTQAHDGKAAILDIDRFGFFPSRLTIEQVVDHIRRYQQDQSKAFKATTTAKAKSTWDEVKDNE